MRRVLPCFFASLVLTLAWTARAGAASYDPAYRFRTLATPHFVIYFHQREALLAQRLAAIAEELWRSVERPLGTDPPALTHVVLVDQTDLANGLATPVPYNTIVMTATWPAGSEFIGKTTDWLRLVFTHEFTHVVHLDRSAGWARVLRGVFGRHPLVFPNLFLPRWQVEGLATYEESAGADEGRLHAGDFRLIVDEAARADRLEPLDRVNGGLTAWPSGYGPYAYGAGFHEYLASRFGESTFAALANDTAGRIPFTASRSFQKVFGQSLGSLWREYQESLSKAPNRRSSSGGARRLTHHGFTVSGPRFDRLRCNGCAERIVYSIQTPQEFPALYEISASSTISATSATGARPRRLAERYLGSTSGVGANAIYFDQQEVQRNAGLYSDLYVLDRRTGVVKRLTDGARLMDPDLSPDGRSVVCVQDGPGHRDLVLVNLAPDAASNPGSGPGVTITTLASEPATQFNAPRWSPNGRTIVVERHSPGHQAEIATVDVATPVVHTVAANPRARFVTPTWRPDGRAVVVAADLDDGPFQLYEIELAATAPDAGRGPQRLRRLTEVPGGATWPDVSPDGKTLAFVGYTVDGFDLFSMAYPDGVDIETAATALEAVELSREPAPSGTAYNPLRTLAPTSWSPIVAGDRTQLRVGLTFGGVDVLGYHGYAVSASWLASGPEQALLPAAGRPDWEAVYQYARWRPIFWAAASSQTSFFAGPPDARGVPLSATLQERQVGGGVLFPILRVRASQTALFSVVRSVDDLQFSDRLETSRRVAARAGWAFTSARTYGYSISPEGGVALGATVDLARRALGSSADGNTVTVDARAYLPLLGAHHVLAVRVAGGSSSGDPEAQRTFVLGGAQPNAATVDFGRSAISLLRGFPSDSFAGSHVALLNAEYRWPLAWLERGHGTWPLFLRVVHAAVFTDVGHAWTNTFVAHDLKTSVGGELSLGAVAGYFAPFTAVVGAAWGHDRGGAVADGASAYVRLGRAF